MRRVCLFCCLLGVALWIGAAHGTVSTEDLSQHVIGVYVDEGAHPSCTGSAIHMFEWMGFSTRPIETADVNGGTIDDLAAIYFPGGDSPPYIDRIRSAGKARLRAAVEGGLAYIGTCAGAMFAAEIQVWEGVRHSAGQLGVFRGEAVGPAPDICPDGEETCVVALVANADHCVAAEGPASILVRYYNSPFLRAAPDVETDVLATYAGTSAAAIVAQRRGEGWVLLTGPHPEWEGPQTWAFIKRCVLWSLGLLNSVAPSNGDDRTCR